MVVVNLSQQTDSSDLLGGFRPVQAGDALQPLLDSFHQLVSGTWTKGNNEAFLSRAFKFAQRGKWSSLLHAFRTAVAKVLTYRIILPPQRFCYHLDTSRKNLPDHAT